jgi:hypothetical protein
MGTHITILELVIVSVVSVLGYVVIKAAYDTWFKA